MWQPETMRTGDLLGGTEIVPERDCWELLSNETVGRLAVVAKGKPDIFPVNFECDGCSIVIRSNMGHKVLASSGAEVAFEVDDFDPAKKLGWSVVIHGPASVEAGEDAGSAWTGSKDYTIRIDARSITGRRIELSPSRS